MRQTIVLSADTASRPPARSARRWRGRILSVLGSLLGVVVLLLLYVAYVYQPPEDRTDTPAYLAWMQSRHFDHYVAAGDFRLHYLHVGSGAPVVLLPGGGVWIYNVRRIVAALAPHYSVYAVDPPGDGYTTPLARHPNYNHLYTLDTIDRSLLAFMDALHLRTAAFIGNSWGGGYALNFAERHLERVSKLVSLDGTGVDLPDSLLWQITKWPLVGEVLWKLFGAWNTPDAVKQTMEYLLVNKQQRVTPDMVREIYVPATFWPNRVSQWVGERSFDWRVTDRLLPRLRTPLLVIWGKEDNVLTPASAFVARWRRRAPAARIVVLDDAGHAVQDDQPQAVNHLILRFLAA